MAKPFPIPDERHSIHSGAATGTGPAAHRVFAARLRFWRTLLVCAAVVVAARLVQVQGFRHAHYSRLAHNFHVRKVVLSAPRGSIFDRNGNTLAMSIRCKSVFVDSLEYRRAVEDAAKRATESHHTHRHGKKAKSQRPRLTPEQGEQHLARLLNVDPAWIHQQLVGRTGRHIVLKKYLPQDITDKIEALRLPWVGCDKEEKRYYPYGTLAAQTIGAAGTDGTGLAGIEAVEDHVLRGRNGRSVLELDARGRKIPTLDEITVAGVPGKAIQLTLDSELQQAVEIALAKGIEKSAAAGGVALVMDPDTGEILALASQPAFDPNDLRKASADRLNNPMVVGFYEPGSTFKLVVACAALETGMSEAQQHVYCKGSLAVGRRTIHCSHDAHGQIDLERLIEQSCNIGAAIIGMRLGQKSVDHYIRTLGFGVKTGIELPGESAGLMPPSSDWPMIRLANVSFGQGIGVTPFQLLRAYCVVANGGRLVRPHLLLDPTIEQQSYPRVLSEDTAATMRSYLVRVVENGTGKAARVQDYLVAGKTGTAQKAIPGQGYASGKYIGSFVGFLPAEKPKVAILVLIDEPTQGYYGGTVAAPVFQEIAQQAMLRLKVPGSPPELIARYAKKPKSRS